MIETIVIKRRSAPGSNDLIETPRRAVVIGKLAVVLRPGYDCAIYHVPTGAMIKAFVYPQIAIKGAKALQKLDWNFTSVPIPPAFSLQVGEILKPLVWEDMNRAANTPRSPEGPIF